MLAYQEEGIRKAKGEFIAFLTVMTMEKNKLNSIRLMKNNLLISHTSYDLDENNKFLKNV